MPNKIYVSQRTNRHIIKRLDSDVNPAVYDSASFGTYKVPGVIDTTLNYPWGITADSSNNIYVCDTKNKRIVKLDSDLAFVDKYDTIPTVGEPYAIMYDSTTGSLYIVGVYAHIYIRIERITTALVQEKLSDNLNLMNDLWFRPTSIMRINPTDFAVGGSNLGLFFTTEGTGFSAFSQQMIDGEYSRWPEIYTKVQYMGVIKHSNGNIYLNDGKRILKVDGSTFANLGDSDLISETLTILKEGVSNSLLTFDIDNKKIVRYDEDLNYVEDIYWHQLRINYNTLVGSFQVGEEVRVSSGYTYGKGIIASDNGMTMYVTVTREGFEESVSLAGVTSEATCNVTSIDGEIEVDANEIMDLVEIIV